MDSNKRAHVLGIDPGPTYQRPLRWSKLHQSPIKGGRSLVPYRLHAVSLEFMSFHKLGSAVSVDFSIMILTSLAHIFPPLFLWILREGRVVIKKGKKLQVVVVHIFNPSTQ